MAVLLSLGATSQEELEASAGWVHDAYHEWREITHDLGAGVVTVPFAQEPPPGSGDRLAPQRAGSSRLLRLPVFRVPLVRGRVLIQHARGLEIADEGRGEPQMLNIVGYEPARRIVVFDTVVGREVRVHVDRLDLVIELTDEVDRFLRRTMWGEAFADRPWTDDAAS